MGCNCGKPKPRPEAPKMVSFILQVDGSRQSFGSRLEAEAAFVRGGRHGEIKKVST